MALTNVAALSPQNTDLAVAARGGAVTILSAAPPVMYPVAVLNAASLLSKPIAPGEIISVFGSGIGPPAATAGFVADDGRLSNAVGGTRVLFDGIPAPVLFARTDQVNVVVPYETMGQNATHVQLEYRGSQSNIVLFPLEDASVGIFTADASGQGPGLILNEDGTMNSPDNPAPPGSVITIFATGAGQTDPPGITGLLGGNTLIRPTLPVRVMVGDTDADVLFAGVPAGSTNGLLQVNVKIPVSIDPGALPISLIIGSDKSQPDVTCAIGVAPAGAKVSARH